MIRADIRETVGQYLSGLMDAELTHFLGRKRYERRQRDVNHRNGSYGGRRTGLLYSPCFYQYKNGIALAVKLSFVQDI